MEKAVILSCSWEAKGSGLDLGRTRHNDPVEKKADAALTVLYPVVLWGRQMFI